MKTSILIIAFLTITTISKGNQNDTIPLPKIVTSKYSETPLRDSPDPNTEIRYKIPKGALLEVTGFFESYLRVRYDSIEGFVSYTLVNSYTKEFGEFVKHSKRVELEKSQIIAQETEIERSNKLKKKYGEWASNRILEGKIWIGMTEEMLLDSWGQPDNINQTVNKHGILKQFIYGLGKYVYVENGKVNAWQN